MVNSNVNNLKNILIYSGFDKNLKRILRSRIKNINNFYGKARKKKNIPPDRCILWFVFICLVTLLLFTKVGVILFFSIVILTLLMFIFNC